MTSRPWSISSRREAARAVRDSYLSKALAMDKDFVDHDTVEEWAEFIYDEINHESLLMM